MIRTALVALAAILACAGTATAESHLLFIDQAAFYDTNPDQTCGCATIVDGRFDTVLIVVGADKPQLQVWSGKPLIVMPRGEHADAEKALAVIPVGDKARIGGTDYDLAKGHVFFARSADQLKTSKQIPGGDEVLAKLPKGAAPADLGAALRKLPEVQALMKQYTKR